MTDEQILAFMREQAYKPMTYQELEQHFQIRGASQFKLFLQLLTKLEETGQVVRTRANRYGVPERMNLLRGRLQVNPKGFAFLINETAGEPDVYIHANDMLNAMHGDTVLARLSSRGPAGGRLEGEVVRVVVRAVTRVVGLFEEKGEFAFVVPDEQRIHRSIFVAREHFGGAVDGQKVVVELLAYPEGRAAAQGQVIEILGHKNDPGVDILSIIRKFQLPEQFDEEVLAEAMQVGDVIRAEELVGRRDLRAKKMVTIDGEDAKDLDDAVSVERLANGNVLLGVHIADVGYYVKEGSALDREAYNRGTSVYLTDRVIPMLPHRLSNGICSLNPQVDRLTMTCEMEFDANGDRQRYDIFPSVICTNERMTYTNVRKLLEWDGAEESTQESAQGEARDEELAHNEVRGEELVQDAAEYAQLSERYADLLDDFRLMGTLAAALRKKRMARGAIDFDFAEAKIIVDEAGKPLEIRKRDRSVAEKLIEEFMLAANETVAEHFYELRVPFLYRVHEDPDSEKLFHFVEFASSLGHAVRGVVRMDGATAVASASEQESREKRGRKGVTRKRTGEASNHKARASSGQGAQVPAKSLQKLLEEIKGTPEEHVISTVMLRSMKQARYSPDSLGHYGLAAEFYSHFTSPIRRYPDLVIHRVMREALTNGGKLDEQREEYLRSRMGDIAQQSSERERLAVDAERETDQLKKAEFMLQHVGEEFDGVISSVTSFGMFVALDNTVEGLIRLSDLDDDYYHFHADHHVLIGERTGRTFRLGDAIRIVVSRVNVNERTIDFVIAGGGLRAGNRGKRGGESATTAGRVVGKVGAASGPVSGAVSPDSADFVPSPRKKKKPNIWEIIERKKQTTNAKQKKARTKDAEYKRSKSGSGPSKKGRKR